MSRIRTIKPEFFLDDELAELPPLTRLLFIGLWTLADCEGRLEDRPKRIRAQIHPFDDGDTGAMLQALHDYGFIHRYAVAGIRYIEVRNFKKHQRITGKEAEGQSSLPPKPDGGNNGETTGKQGGNKGETAVAQEGKGKEGKGREEEGKGREPIREGRETRARPREEDFPKGKPSHPMTTDWQPSQTALDILSQQGINAEFAQSCLPEFQLYWIQRGDTRPGWDACFINSVRRSWEKRPPNPGVEPVYKTRPKHMTIMEWEAYKHRTTHTPEYDTVSAELDALMFGPRPEEPCGTQH